MLFRSRADRDLPRRAARLGRHLPAAAPDRPGRCAEGHHREPAQPEPHAARRAGPLARDRRCHRSEEHTSELQSRFDLVCRLLLDKKNHIRAPRAIASYPKRSPDPRAAARFSLCSTAAALAESAVYSVNLRDTLWRGLNAWTGIAR